MIDKYKKYMMYILLKPTLSNVFNYIISTLSLSQFKSKKIH
jgi:hypothetical protein